MNNMMQMMNKFFGGNVPAFDESAFRKMLPNLNDQMLQQAVNIAKSLGMPENQIKEGIEFLKQFKK